MNDIPQEFKSSIDDLTADLKTARLPLHVATATLPISKEIQQALHNWHEHLPLALEAAGKPPQGFYISIAADLQRVTWQTVGATPDFTSQLLDYLDELDIPKENLSDLEQDIDSVKPSQLGAWITGYKDSFDLGWYLAPRGNLLENALPYLPESPDKSRLMEWATHYKIDECVRLGRSLASRDQLSDVTLKISAETPRRAVEVGLLLLRSLALPFPPDAFIDSMLRQEQSDIFASLWLGPAGAAKVGILLPQPSTELVLRLCAAAGQNQEKALAIFEACLGAGGPIFAEPQQLAEGWGVELHYAVEENETRK